MPLLIVSTQQKLQPFEPPSDNWSAVLVASFSVFFMVSMMADIHHEFLGKAKRL